MRAQGTVPKEGTIVGPSVYFERYPEAVVSEPVTVTLCGRKGLCRRDWLNEDGAILRECRPEI